MRLYKEIALALFLSLGTGFAHAGDTIVNAATVNADKAKLKGQVVTIQGTVVKVNNGIMKRNFVHIEDGSAEGDNGRLIITSQDTAKQGDRVTVTGTVALDTDFGFGYLYPLLIEKATIKQDGAAHNH